MKVERKTRNTKASLSAVDFGECFINPPDNSLYMKIYENQDNSSTDTLVIRLDTAMSFRLPNHQEVIIVDAKITIYEGYTTEK